MKCAIYATDCMWNREKERVEDLMDPDYKSRRKDG